ncbi:MAG: GNAT family N-acetyltransferase [Alteraurantiacibacter sp.]
MAPHASLHLPSRSADGATAPGVRLTLRRWTDCQDAPDLAAWQALAEAAAEPNPFFESWFLLPSLRALDPQGKVELLWLEVGGKLAGLMPLRRETSYYGYPLPHLRNWVHANAFCGLPLVTAGMELVFWREVIAWCDSHARTALFLHLVQMPGDGVLHTSLKGLLAGERRTAATVQSEERAMLASRLAPEVYLEQSLTGKKRKELRRQQRRLGELGELATQRLCKPVDVARWADQFLALEQRGWKGLAGSALAGSHANAAWFREALVGAAELGRVECLSLTLDGKPLAMLATFLTAPGAYSFKTAFDEDYARFSPGVLLQAENLALLDRPGIDWTDSCAAPDHLMIDHIWRERRRIVRHSLAIGGPARQKLFGMLVRHETGFAAGGLA